MTISLYDMTGVPRISPTTIATFPTYEDAVNYVNRELVVSYFEEAPGYPGFASFIANGVAVYSLEPTLRRAASVERPFRKY